MKRKKFEGREYNRVMRSTRAYYENFSEGYVRFYENWLKGEGEFSDPTYKEGYDTVASLLSKTATSGERIIDIGCGVGTWSTLLAEKGAYVASLDNLPACSEDQPKDLRHSSSNPEFPSSCQTGFAYHLEMRFSTAPP